MPPFAAVNRRFRSARLSVAFLALVIWALAILAPATPRPLQAEECHDVLFLADPVVDVDSEAGEIRVSWATRFESESPVLGESHTFTNRVSLWRPGGTAAGARGGFRETVLTMGPGGQVVNEYLFENLEPGTHTLVVHLDLFDDVEECGSEQGEQADNKFAENFDIVEP